MKLTAKVVSVFILLLLSVPIFLFSSCGSGSGSNFFTGGACGGCPNSTAPDGSTINSSTADINQTWTITSSSTSFAGCMNRITFTVKDKAGNPLDNICVELFTNGFFALPSPNAPGSCTNDLYTQTYLRQRTDTTGTVTVDFADIVTRPTSTTPSATAAPFIQATSCNATITVRGTWTVNWQ